MRKPTTKRAAAKPKAADAAPEATNNGVQAFAPATAPKAPAKKPAARKATVKKATNPAAKTTRTATSAKPKARKMAAKPAARKTTATKPRVATKNPATRIVKKVAKAKTTRKRVSAKRKAAIDSSAMVFDAIISMKGLEKTARRLLGEITKRDAEIAKLKSHVVDLNGQLKRAKQGNKRQERAAERALLRAHATVRRHASKAAAASTVTKISPKKVPSFAKALDNQMKKSPAKKVSHHKHAAAHAKHKKLADLGHQVVSSIKHHI